MDMINKNIEKLFDDFVNLKTINVPQNIKNDIAIELKEMFKAECDETESLEAPANAIDKIALIQAASWLDDSRNVDPIFINNDVKDTRSSNEIKKGFNDLITAAGYSMNADVNEVLKEVYRRQDNRLNGSPENPKHIEDRDM